MLPLLGAGSVKVRWKPSLLSGLSLWLTASPVWCFSDAAGTVPCANGDLVYTWKDRSAGAHHLVQATSAKRPTFRTLGTGYCVDFGGYGVDVAMGVTAALALRAVCARWSIYNVHANFNHFYFAGGSSTKSVRTGNSNWGYTDGNVYAGDDLGEQGASPNTDVTRYRVNGVSGANPLETGAQFTFVVTTPAAVTTSAIALGGSDNTGSSPGATKIQELFVPGNAMSAADIAAAEAYLTAIGN